MSGLINKVKDAIHSDKDKKHDSTTTGTHNTHNTHSSGLPEGTTGPHSSRAANAADPRVDSDLDSSRHTGAGHTTGGLGSTTGTAGHTTGHTTGGFGSHSENMPGHSTTGGMGRSSGLPEGSVGPHSSRAANAADPRVDSDLDSTRRTGAGHTAGGLGSHSENMPGRTTGITGNTGMTGTGMTGTGRHTENMPGLGGSTYDQTTTGTSGFSSHGTGAHGPTGTHTGAHTGTHSSGLSGAHTGTHSSGLSGAHSGSHMGGNTAYDSTNPGPAPKTAGPHKSDMLNKADPRVDSNLDGSKTLGKEKTFETSEPNFAGRDPTDATQVPPSIMQKHVPTEIAHDNPESDHSRRHSSVNQEHHRGL
ncbi:period circadian [Fusarium langsethiae]|uniref:Period circadian n=1 Tax=Fusarium langsethiae TaxID=179993 RepID=A0A0M9EUE7_FUSLA|nr:period circadian [Fusarium langsethiae]